MHLLGGYFEPKPSHLKDRTLFFSWKITLTAGDFPWLPPIIYITADPPKNGASVSPCSTPARIGRTPLHGISHPRTHLPTHPLSHSFTNPLIYQPTSPIHLDVSIHPLTYPLTDDPHIYPFTHSPTWQSIHLCTYSHPQSVTPLCIQCTHLSTLPQTQNSPTC